MKLVLCAWFPNWPIQRITLEEADRLRAEPFLVLHSAERTTPRVVACSLRAERRGVHAGMPVAEARSVIPRGTFLLHDPSADEASLRALARECFTWTPRTGLEESPMPQCLFLDLTGCVPHLGTVQDLSREIGGHFRKQGYDVRIGVAPTWGAAWAIARECVAENLHVEPQPRVIEDNDSIERTLRPLPARRLRLPGETLALLEECGLRTIGQLLDLCRGTIPSRLGTGLLLRLDQAMGRTAEMLTPEPPPAPVESTLRFEEPLTGMELLQPALTEILDDVAAQLQERRLQTQYLLVDWKTCESAGGTAERFELRLLRPTDSSAALQELLLLRFETLSLSGGLGELRIEAVPCLPERSRQTTLFEEDEGRREREFHHFIERLNSRLGSARSLRLSLTEDIQPERSYAAEPWEAKKSEEGQKARNRRDAKLPQATISRFPLLPDRPLRLMARPASVTAVVDGVDERPVRFRWQQREQVVSLCTGPERIVTGWWRGVTVTRDYYRVETAGGTRFWLFRERGTARWFLQGAFE